MIAGDRLHRGVGRLAGIVLAQLSFNPQVILELEELGVEFCGGSGHFLLVEGFGCCSGLTLSVP